MDNAESKVPSKNQIWIKPSSIIMNNKLDTVIVKLQIDNYLCRIGVLHNVVKGFLCNTVECNLHLSRHFIFATDIQSDSGRRPLPYRSNDFTQKVRQCRLRQ